MGEPPSSAGASQLRRTDEVVIEEAEKDWGGEGGALRVRTVMVEAQFEAPISFQA
jgi:hypothetical protein